MGESHSQDQHPEKLMRIWDHRLQQSLLVQCGKIQHCSALHNLEKMCKIDVIHLEIDYCFMQLFLTIP